MKIFFFFFQQNIADIRSYREWLIKYNHSVVRILQEHIGIAAGFTRPVSPDNRD